MDQLLSTQPMEDASSEQNTHRMPAAPSCSYGSRADAYTKPHARLNRQGTRSFAAPCARASWPDDAPIHYAMSRDGTPAYKVTIAPPPERPLRSNTWGTPW